ncbi:MAG TPA: collagenase [Prolixibacteraceae bacterium]|nr:collagenase [Prolixibacteraceae bacterium]
MRKIAILFFVMVLSFTSWDCFSKGPDIFRYNLYDDLTPDNISSVKSKLENNIERIANDFGLDINTIGKFNVNIWHNKNNFLNAMQKNIGYRYENAVGYLGYSDIYILFIDNPQVMINATGLLYCFTADEVAEHELAHSLSLRISSTFINNPRWFWETVAEYESNEIYDPKKLSYLEKGDYPTLDELNNNFDNGDYRIYQVGYLLGQYIVSQWGKDKYIDLIKQNGNISSVLGISNEEFETGWKSYIDTVYFNTTGINEIASEKEIKMKYCAGRINIEYTNEKLTGSQVQFVDVTGRQIAVYHLTSSPANYTINPVVNHDHAVIVIIRKDNFLYSHKIRCSN